MPAPVRPAATPPRPSRRPRVPPALTRGADPLEGLGVLDELRGDLGLVLWRSLRNILLWAETAPEERGALFARAAAHVRREDVERLELDAELLAPLSVIVALLETPGQVDVPRLVNACRRVALWAEQRGAVATALEFTQAAALAAPDSAALAFAVGRLARRHSEYDRAESWYTRAAVQGRENRDWKAYVLALSGMGNLYIQRGNYPAARRAHLRCLHATQRRGVTQLLGDSYHALFVVEAEMGAGTAADPLAAQAFRAYGPHNPKVLRLAYDVVNHWTLQGCFAAAGSVASALLPHMQDPSMSALVQGLMARAAAGAGQRAAFERAAAGAEALIAQGVSHEMTASTLVHLANAAMSICEWEQASRWAAEALRIAQERREGRTAIEADAALDAAQRRIRRPVPAQDAMGEAAEALAGEFVEALAGHRTVAVG